MADKWEIAIDRASCRGSGLCAAFSPEVFELDGDKSRPRASTVAADPTVTDAALSCPTQAITVTDAITGALVYPED